MTTLETLTTNLNMCCIKSNRFSKLNDYKQNLKWIESVNNSIYEAKEMLEFLTFYKEKDIIKFFTTQDIIFRTYLEMFFYEGWIHDYNNTTEILKLSILQSNLQSYCVLESSIMNDPDDIFRVIQLIIYIYTEILSIIN